MTYPASLSPAAQAVLDAFLGDAEDTGLQMDDLRENVAAAIYALADQVVPKREIPRYAGENALVDWSTRDDVRDDLLRIANELNNA